MKITLASVKDTPMETIVENLLERIEDLEAHVQQLEALVRR